MAIPHGHKIPLLSIPCMQGPFTCKSPKGIRTNPKASTICSTKLCLTSDILRKIVNETNLRDTNEMVVKDVTMRGSRKRNKFERRQGLEAIGGGGSESMLCNIYLHGHKTSLNVHLYWSKTSPLLHLESCTTCWAFH